MLHKFAITNTIFVKCKIEFVEQSKPCTKIYLQKMVSYLNLQLPIVIYKIDSFRHASSENEHAYQFSAKSG